MKVILQGVVGSQAYGLAGPGSDIDQQGIFLSPIDTLLGLQPEKETFAQTNPDVTLHELGKYCRLALKANPTVLELMYCTEYRRQTRSAEWLVDSRDDFLSTRYVRNAYGGYATEQWKRIFNRVSEGGGPNLRRMEKAGRHSVRLLLQGQELLSTGNLTLDISSKKDYIFEAGRLAISDQDKFKEVFDKEIQKMDSISSILPDEPDVDEINYQLLAIRWEEHARG